jgi:hypothetical protein
MPAVAVRVHRRLAAASNARLPTIDPAMIHLRRDRRALPAGSRERDRSNRSVQSWESPAGMNTAPTLRASRFGAITRVVKLCKSELAEANNVFQGSA